MLLFVPKNLVENSSADTSVTSLTAHTLESVPSLVVVESQCITVYGGGKKLKMSSVKTECETSCSCR